jgi:hypothetical protein
VSGWDLTFFTLDDVAGDFDTQFQRNIRLFCSVDHPESGGFG